MRSEPFFSRNVEPGKKGASMSLSQFTCEICFLVGFSINSSFSAPSGRSMTSSVIPGSQKSLN